jgi:RES domain-containing protein
MAGGRYNPAGKFGALYSSLEEETAIAEVAKGLRASGVEPVDVPPGEWLIYEIEVEHGQFLDLTDPDALAKLAAGEGLLISTDLSLTQRLASEARKRGYKGILAPSAARPGGINLILFPDDNLSPKVLTQRPVMFVKQ